jgi:hypothetical protein
MKKHNEQYQIERKLVHGKMIDVKVYEAQKSSHPHDLTDEEREEILELIRSEYSHD